MTHRTLSLASLALAGILLAGCAAVIPDPGSIIEETIEGATGTDVETGTLPSDWPGLPTPDGDLVSSLAADGTYVLSYTLDDEAKIDALRDELLADGFEVTAESSGDLNTLVMASPDWTISLGWYETDGTIGLNYGATPRLS